MTTNQSLVWLLEQLVERTPGAQHAVVLSRDGLKLCWTSGLSVDQADQLAAIASGIASLSGAASVEFGSGSGRLRSAMSEFDGGLLLIVEAGEGAHLTVLADGAADAGVIGHNMHGLVEQLGDNLVAEPRDPVGQPG
ncbi:MAG TPA: roadblock/LC7 domain-containing protein [Pseudonocardiaceae bacterium]|nr:roadblock/LC7 domain-containing protein [Pseudonocardiaceae bacterium]